jgi:DNA-binding IclR family transcriptional regulator
MDSISGVGVLDKAMTLLDALRRAGPMGLGELHERTGMARATAHRLAVALERHGLVRRDAEGRFALGLGLVDLGRVAASGLPVAAVARPIMETLRDRTGESVQLFVRDGEGRRCVVSLESTHGLRWIVPEGALLPLEKGSAGRILDDSASAPSRPADASAWAESVEEREKGVASVSAAVRDRTGAVVAALSVSGPVERLTRTPGRRFGVAVAAAAEEIGRLLRS